MHDRFNPIHNKAEWSLVSNPNMVQKKREKFSKCFSDIMKIAIGNRIRQLGYDPENCIIEDYDQSIAK